jgi:hypothetical protein
MPWIEVMNTIMITKIKVTHTMGLHKMIMNITKTIMIVNATKVTNITKLIMLKNERKKHHKHHKFYTTTSRTMGRRIIAR